MSRYPPIKIKKFDAEVVEKSTLTEDTVSLVLQGNIDEFPFYPGQFVMIHFEVEGKVENRAYSIASCPQDGAKVELIVREEKEGTVSIPLNRVVDVGDTLQISGPFGRFILDEDAKTIYALAAGSGIVPFISFCRHVAAEKLDIDIVILYSSRHEDNIISEAELEELTKKHDNITVIHTVTQPKSSKWHGLTGRFDTKVLEEYIDDKKAPIYVCGGNSFIMGMHKCLTECGIVLDNVHTEDYG